MKKRYLIVAFPKYLIVNADDFGLSSGVNRGIIKSHEQGIVTSASLMVRWAWCGRRRSLCAGTPKTFGWPAHRFGGMDLCRRPPGRPVYEVVPMDNATAIAAEVERQLDLFRSLVGAQSYTPRFAPARPTGPNQSLPLPLRHALELGIVLRGHHFNVRYCGRFLRSGRPKDIHIRKASRSMLCSILSSTCPLLSQN